MSTLLNSLVSILGNEDARTLSDTLLGVVKRQYAELPPCPQMSCFAVARNGDTIGSPVRTRADQSGGRMAEASPGTPPSVRLPEDPLDSWKEIAAYLHRDVKTVQRWEKREGMPVHRHVHDKRGSVYALSSELDAWLQSRKLRLEEGEKRTPRARPWIVLGGVAALALFAVT